MESAFPTAARLGLHALLYSSLLLNALFVAQHFLSAPPAPSPLLSEAKNGGGSGALSWALRAAWEAESVAAAGCSGHGRVFLDGIVGEDGRPGCECNTCFEGPDCSVRTPDCTVNADSGDPMFLEPYWMRHAEASAVVVSGWHRMSYRTTDGLFQSVELERREYRWGGNTAMWANASGNSTTKEDIIEFVTSPNNPDALLHQPVVGGASAILDHAYFWPHFTHIPAPSDEDVMLFTTSKLSGHASSRFGWALIRDEKVAKRVNDYMMQNTMGASRDTQLRMLSIFKAILANLHGKEDIFAFGHDVMRAKWRKLSAVVSRSRRISLQNIPPQYCTYFHKIREPSPAYAWVKCEREEDGDCSDVLLKAKIITRSGVWNDASSRYTRISLIKSKDDFDLLLERITEFVDAELSAAGSNSM